MKQQIKTHNILFMISFVVYKVNNLFLQTLITHKSTVVHTLCPSKNQWVMTF